MILLTWNLNSRVKDINEQLNRISGHNADVLAFQEVTKGSKDLLKENLQSRGYEYVLDSFSLSKEPDELTGKRKYGQIIASKYELRARDPELFDVPWKERILSADIITQKGKIELHTTHIPPGATNGWKKIEMFEGIFKKLNVRTKKLRILCGDFNSPQAELKDGTLITWAQRLKNNGNVVNVNFKKSRGSRWDDGERNVIEKLKYNNLTDVYRKVHGYNKQDYSWHVNHGNKAGRRFDHIFASAELNPRLCFYDHEVRSSRLSDHSALVALFDYDQ